MFKDCWGLANGLRVPIWKALYQEGQKISDAFLKTFENLGRLGFRIRGAQHRNVRVKGTIVWIKRLEGEIQGVEGYFPWRASLDSLSDEIVKPKYLFGGQMSIASVLEDGPECVEIIRLEKFLRSRKKLTRRENFWKKGGL
ncbi:uncharacterized protein EAF02_002622 [Botrytis sinoallii]|uniref:uncharacterized protein n=1 Tax=Botrytis sinoallii TaxID=1463999 RepID=UPI0019007CD4|nr:uncharacterized protein EAF02_002622 [Botrytis sinoallii]KAF7888081.1 hypothetical protein EAF02_002622 [Botrytis sinoallii]